ncbi:type 1 glutamine amidotransferase domain-containing protein [Pseudomonas sp. JS3066]|jgi:putative intracellular protease/amidase|uniref:type 1 glutamine amidotransferase domain-containing protein n=1 Tax=unclassified Pseudomonas TaxID=196821 RepID=UPI000EA8B0E1|nr:MULTISPECIES: type 1 glutamine amidotransferase domain-containing protein [unclassified Pseudomonas]AYF87692.1 type 1 glutamine amidotransferase domain-containing protein [Pseudomonas sp. DY-1]MDH4655469.1 type 1 glutamine amidotransferase domain-containing protein [Pseudomonas sp. BN606]MRK20028.1 type 1 glutamine amidotransferase domain-containing protein [Pseudomonas sp. JG-B]WVK94747.1 type 1 glutamine amidotransferase domain-containing protein [Pseudomonas sp. JS3066]
MTKVSTLALALAGAMLAGTANAAPKGEVLVLLSSENQLPLKDGKQYPTGFYLNEFGVPADHLLKAGYALVLVTPRGNAPSVDKRSIDPQYFGGDAAEMKRIQNVVEGLPGMNDSLSLQEVLAGDLDRYAGLLIPGGHAPLIDLANNPEVGALLRHFHQAGKPTAAICHGPIALLSAQDDPASYQAALARGEKPAASNWLYQGYRMTIFADPEEQVFESSLNGDRILFYPAKAMAGAGGDMAYATAWSPNVVVDRELITGQNPFSDHALAKALVEKLGVRKSE